MSLLRDTVRSFYKSLNCPRSLACWLLFDANEHRQLAELSWDPHHYNDAISARDSLAATKFLSKAKKSILNTGIDLKAVALENFEQAEQQCRDTNRRIFSRKLEDKEAFDLITLGARDLIGDVLGEFLTEELVDGCSWGPGATLSIRKKFATPPKKFLSETDITPLAYNTIVDFFPLWFPNWEPKFQVKGANRVVTVSKDAKRNRTIAIEPGLNLWFQKSIGRMIRKRLRRRGIDLNDQTRNQMLARYGSLTGLLATVDFSMASDTVAFAVVELLLPPRWFELLRRFRSTQGEVDGTLLNYHKFSSMGNGFTFELESLIFWALAKATCDYCGISSRNVGTFGDDVVIPSRAYDTYVEVCEDLGFRINATKSYNTSMYRESCGSHYWDGIDIKPIFLKDNPENDSKTVVKLANSIRALSHRRSSYGCDRRFLHSWSALVRHLDKLYLSTSAAKKASRQGKSPPRFPRVPYTLGDSGIIVDFDELRSNDTVRPAPRGFEGFEVKGYVTVPSMIDADHQGLLLHKLMQAGSSFNEGLNSFVWNVDSDYRRLWAIDGNERCIQIIDVGALGNETLNAHLTTDRQQMILVPQWRDLGPWVYD